MKCKYEIFFEAVKDMRKKQKTYFKTRKKNDLETALESEKTVDYMMRIEEEKKECGI